MIHRLLVAVLIALLSGCSAVPAAGPTRAPTAAATIPTSQATSAPLSYAEKVRRAIKVNIVAAEPIEDSPVAEVEVRTSPDGAIVGVTLINSSGVPHWDRAVQVALWKTERIPLDVNGKVPPLLRISFRPKAE